MTYIDNNPNIKKIGHQPQGNVKSKTSLNIDCLAKYFFASLNLFKALTINVLIPYFTNCKVANKTSPKERDAMMNAIRFVAEEAISPAELTEIANYMEKKQGSPKPDINQIDTQRFKRKRDGAGHTLTPLAIADDKRIDGLLIHLDKVGEGAFSTVKSGIMLSKTGNHWTAKKVAIHKEIKLTANGEAYKRDILKHQQLFGVDRHANIDNGPLLHGLLSSDRAFMLHDLAPSDLSHYQIQSSQELFQLAKDIAQGLDFYHKHQVLFCDLKPDNILISGDGRAILFDPAEQAENAVHYIQGTPAFLPAEMGDKEVKQNRSWDLYALGTVLLEMKYNYLSNQVNKLTSAERKKYLHDQMKSNIGIDIKKAVEESGAFTSIMTAEEAHKCQRQRLISESDQNQLLDGIFGSDENLPELKKQLAKYDETVAKLISFNPSERPQAQQVIEDLRFE